MKRLLFAAAFVAAAIFANSQNSIAVNPYAKTISVSGSSEMEIVPDEIYVLIDLKEYKKKGENKTELDKIKSDFLAKCKSVGIADSLISIASYEGVNYNYWAVRRKKKDPDMLSGITYQIKFGDSKKMDQLVEILDDEATTNFRIARVSHSRIIEFRKQLKIQAIKAAKDKGFYLADAINEKVAEAVTIIEPEENQSSLYENNRLSQFSNVLEEKTQSGGDYAGPTVDFKKIKLRYEVNVVFALK